MNVSNKCILNQTLKYKHLYSVLIKQITFHQTQTQLAYTI